MKFSKKNKALLLILCVLFVVTYTDYVVLCRLGGWRIELVKELFGVAVPRPDENVQTIIDAKDLYGVDESRLSEKVKTFYYEDGTATYRECAKEHRQVEVKVLASNYCIFNSDCIQLPAIEGFGVLFANVSIPHDLLTEMNEYSEKCEPLVFTDYKKFYPVCTFGECTLPYWIYLIFRPVMLLEALKY